MISRNILNHLRKINPVLTKIPVRSFSTFKVDSLKNILKSEINHEETNYTPVDQNELNQFFQSTKFQFKEFENSVKMELRKIENKMEIIVNFQAKPPTPQPETEPGQEEQTPEILNDFSIRITKAGSNAGLLVYCTLIDNTIEYNSVSHSENVHELYKNEQNTDAYLGPEFSTLEEKLQDEFINYFNTLGINNELSAFIQVLSVDRDQRLYLKWLKDVNNFLV